ncbi:sulfatase-like hydrolase/transferase, partial [Alphaproteobacteria bacterium]|nr:sulfatase-like hydrolase/transferase [Alphaproteobacteria bacterium]
MIKDKPNIILINIDGLRYDHVGLHGHVPSITPSIDQIFARGLRLSNMFTHGCPTQFASPSIFTSSLPLDCGGYDFGIRNRQKSFVECLREAGYWTVGYALSGPLTNFYAYHRGFEEYYHLQDLSVFLTALWTSYVNHYNRRFDDGEITDAECLGVLTPLIGQAIETLIGLCDEKLSEVRADGINRSRLFHDQDYTSAARYVAEQKEVFSSDPDTYIRTRILGNSWREAFPILGAPRENKWLRIACRRATVALTKWNFQFRPPLSKAPDGQIVDQICRAVDRLDDRPHFIWANLMSLHDG